MCVAWNVGSVQEHVKPRRRHSVRKFQRNTRLCNLYTEPHPVRYRRLSGPQEPPELLMISKRSRKMSGKIHCSCRYKDTRAQRCSLARDPRPDDCSLHALREVALRRSICGQPGMACLRFSTALGPQQRTICSGLYLNLESVVHADHLRVVPLAIRPHCAWLEAVVIGKRAPPASQAKDKAQ